MKKLLLITALLCGTAQAEYFTGNDLQRWADSNSNDMLDFGMLYGYVSGVYDSGSGVNHCAPKGVTLRQVVDVVRQHVARTPASRNFSGDTIISYILKETWPCANQRRGTSS